MFENFQITKDNWKYSFFHYTVKYSFQELMKQFIELDYEKWEEGPDRLEPPWSKQHDPYFQSVLLPKDGP